MKMVQSENYSNQGFQVEHPKISGFIPKKSLSVYLVLVKQLG